MLKLQYIVSAAPTCWNIVDVPQEPHFPINGQTNYQMYEYKLKLAKEKCIPIREEDQEAIWHAAWENISTKEKEYFNFSDNDWQPDESKLYDIDGFEF